MEKFEVTIPIQLSDSYLRMLELIRQESDNPELVIGMEIASQMLPRIAHEIGRKVVKHLEELSDDGDRD